MTPEQFNEVVERRKQKISEVLQTKAMEYSRGTDRLHNFKRSAAFARKSAIYEGWQFNLKHLTSLADIVDDYEAGKVPLFGVLQEKIGDAINYLILLEALFLEVFSVPASAAHTAHIALGVRRANAPTIFGKGGKTGSRGRRA